MPTSGLPSLGEPLSERHSHAILGAIWTIAGITTLLFGARIYVRFRYFSKFQWDDLLVTIAWCLSIPLGAQATVINLAARKPHAGVGPLFTNRLLTQAFFYTSVWCIKFAFLIFFRRIGGTALQGIKIYWIIVTVITALSYLILWSFNPYGCYIRKGLSACAFDSESNLTPVTFKVACAIDIFTDCLIMAIPFVILHGVRITRRQRFVLYSLFSLVIITIAVSLARAVLGSRGIRSGRGITTLILLAHIEASTAISVACLSSFRALFTQERGKTRIPSKRRSWKSSPLRKYRSHSESIEGWHLSDLQHLPQRPPSSWPSSNKRDLDLV